MCTYMYGIRRICFVFWLRRRRRSLRQNVSCGVLDGARSMLLSCSTIYPHLILVHTYISGTSLCASLVREILSDACVRRKTY